MLFQYPRLPRRRRHGPQGYEAYASYKPWLRDEFAFQCIYCLCREVWFPDGQAAFGIDHLRPVTVAPAEATRYDNLVYACLQCNSGRQDLPLPLHPVDQGLAEHLELGADGNLDGRTAAGQELIAVCRLNRRPLVAYRRHLLALVSHLEGQASPEAGALLQEIRQYPKDLPDLASLRPPRGNSRPEGIADSNWQCRLRGQLPDTY